MAVAPFMLGHFLQGQEPRPPALPQDLEPLAHQDAVFPQDRDHVGGGAQGHQVQVGPEIGFGVILEPALLPQSRPHPQGQEQGHPHPGQHVKGIGLAAPLGVDHRQGRGQLRGQFVVVGDDDLEAVVPGPGHLRQRR